MPHLLIRFFCVRFLAAGFAVIAAPSLCHAAQPTVAARMETFAQPGGETYFALQLTPQIAQPKRSSCDVVVLFDTSASQTGEFRQTALEALDGLLAGLSRDDRVALLAVDLDAVALTPAMGGAVSEAMRAALSDLRGRVPLGSTDMGRALEAALASFDAAANSDRARSVVYIGDGMSTARLIFSDRMRALMDRFAEARVSISSYAVGPRLDLQLLGSLAKHTGGMLAVDNDQRTGRAAGGFLADAAQAPIVWPTDVKLPRACHGVYFRGLAPLRFDRSTVLLGTLDEAAAASLESLHIGVRGEVAGKTVDLAWDVKPEAANADHAYLAKLVETGRRDGGASLPSLGSEGLADLRWLVGVGAWNLTKLAEQALATGNLQQADQLAAEAGRLDPNNAEAAVVMQMLHKARQPYERNNPRSLKLDAERREAADGEAADGEAVDGQLLDQVDRQDRVFEAMLRTEVQNAVNQARGIMTSDPANATSLLKLTQERVARATELESDVRRQMNDQLEAALEAAGRQAVVRANRDLRRAKIAAETEARERINRDLLLRDQKVDQLMARFEALMDEDRYRDAEAVAGIAEQMEPGRPGLRTAELTSRMVGYTTDIYALRDARHRGFVDMLYATETSHVPTSDEPPIVYPDPEVWRAQTEKRKKWKAVDLARRGESEAKILAALSEQTELDFSDQPLSDVIDYVKAKHQIEIQFDNKALADQGVGSDTPVTRILKGISLRSALRLLLGELDLTYVVKDEVMMITTKTEAENILANRVYPVADLVVPISTPRMGGMGGSLLGGPGMGGSTGGMGLGGMGLGGMGMGGMGLGGMGLGGMGMGMGGMGMGMGGMGMGMGGMF